MCGIAGVISKSEIKPAIVRAMTEVIRHRGPDDEGYILIDGSGNLVTAGGQDTPSAVWSAGLNFSPGTRIDRLVSSYQIILGHRRLSILDLSPTGHQPFSYSDGRYWICFNGMIYNHKEIREELRSLGHDFISGTDTEVIVAAYAEWGTGCLNKFAGMWAFAIYDHFSGSLCLARDRYGIKPLYYWFSDEETLFFASEIKQFTVLDGWQAEINRERAYDQLVYSFTDHTDETMFKGVFQLPAGMFYLSSIREIKPDPKGRILFKRWYFLERQQFRGSFQDAAARFRELFDRSVVEHLCADVPVGTALSGGLDSSSIVCEIDRLLREKVNHHQQSTFSSCATNEVYDERKWMDIVVAHTNVEANFIYPDLEEVFSLTSKILWHQDEPYQSQSAFLGYNVFRLASQTGIRVLLNGQGADEYLGGYGQFTAARYAGMLKRFHILSFLRDLRNSRMINPISFTRLLKGMAFSLLPQPLLERARQKHSSADHLRSIINTDQLADKPSNPMDIIPIGYSTVPEISVHLTFYSTLPKYLRWEDRNSMAHSIEARVPFLDHRLVEFAYSLPDNFLEKDGINKRVMRTALSDLLPEKISNRKDKMGFITPEEIWVRKDNPLWFRKRIEEALDVSGGIIKPEALKYFDNVVNGSVPFDYTYWRLIMFSEWIKLFGVKV